MCTADSLVQTSHTWHAGLLKAGNRRLASLPENLFNVPACIEIIVIIPASQALCASRLAIAAATSLSTCRYLQAALYLPP